jgi:hypothetical protein
MPSISLQMEHDSSATAPTSVIIDIHQDQVAPDAVAGDPARRRLGKVQESHRITVDKVPAIPVVNDLSWFPARFPPFGTYQKSQVDCPAKNSSVGSMCPFGPFGVLSLGRMKRNPTSSALEAGVRDSSETINVFVSVGQVANRIVC